MPAGLRERILCWMAVIWPEMEVDNGDICLYPGDCRVSSGDG